MDNLVNFSSTFVESSSNFKDIFVAFKNIAEGLEGFAKLVPGAK